MSLLTKDHKQDATLWSLTGSTGAFAEPVYAAPVALKVRWEERSELFTNSAGEKEVAHDVVYLGTDIKTGDFLFLGTSVVATPIAAARLVKDFRKVPELNGRDFERRALL